MGQMLADGTNVKRTWTIIMLKNETLMFNIFKRQH